MRRLEEAQVSDLSLEISAGNLQACAADGKYEFLLTAKPLNLVGGVGSPANAMAVK